MANNLESGSDEEFEGFPCQTTQSPKARPKKRKLLTKALESTEEEDDDDNDDFKGSVRNSGRKRKALEAFESDEDESGSDEDGDSSDDDDDTENDDDDDDDDDDEDDDDEDDIDNGVEDALDVDLNEDDDDMATNSDQCPICLMSLGGQKLGTPNDCQHVFCLACILEWSKNANTCPVDRKVFHEILVHSTKKGPILQRIPVEDRRVPDVGWEQEPTFCEVCNQCDREDRMLLCDGCDKGYHLECLRPRLYTVPAGSWYCTTCLEIRQNERMEDNEDSVPELMPGTVRRSRDLARTSTRSESSEISDADGSQRARTAATNRRRSSSTRGRGRGRGRTGSRSSGRGRSRSRTTGRSRTGSSTRRGRGGKKKTRKRSGRTTSTTGKPKRKKRKRTSTKKKRSTTTSKAKKRKVDKEGSYRNPFDAQSFRGRTPKERLSNSLRASGSSLDTGRGLGMSSGLSILGDNYALDSFEDDSTNVEPEQSDSSSVKSASSDVLGSIFDSIETLHDKKATVSRDGRVLPSELHDKRSPNTGIQVKPNESTSNSTSRSGSREGSDIISTARDPKQDEKLGSERSGNESCDSSRTISSDNRIESHILMHKSRDADVTKCSRDQGREEKQKADRKAETTLSTNAAYPVRRSLVNAEEFKVIKKDNDHQTSLRTDLVKQEGNADPTMAGYTDHPGNTRENKPFKHNSDKTSSRTANLHKKSTKPTKSGQSLKLSTNDSSFLGSRSKGSLKNPHSSASVTPTRFKIPKKNSALHESSCPKDIPLSRNLPSDSRSRDPQRSKLSNSTVDFDTSTSKRSTPTNEVFPRTKRVSPIVWTDRDSESLKVRALKETSRAVGTKSSPVVSRASSPKTSKISKDNELNSSNDTKKSVNLTDERDFKDDFATSVCDSKEKPEKKTDDVIRVPRDASQQSAFTPFKKNKVLKDNSKCSTVNQEGTKVVPTTEVTARTSCLRNQSPSFNSKPSLQQLKSSIRSSSPSNNKALGIQASSTCLTGSMNTGSTARTEKQPQGQDARVIKYSKEKGELKIKVVPGNEDINAALRSLPEEPRPVLRNLPEEPRPVLRNLPEETRPVLRNLPEETRPVLRNLPEETRPVLQNLPEEPRPVLRNLTEDTRPVLRKLNDEIRLPSRNLPEDTHPSLRSLPSLSVEPSIQPSLTSLKPLKPVAKQSQRPKLKMLSSSEAFGTSASGIPPSRDLPKRTNQNRAIIQMLRHKTSTLRAEVEKEHSLSREDLESNARETAPEPLSESPSRSSSSSSSIPNLRPSHEECQNQREMTFNRPKLSSLLSLPRSSSLPVAVVRPSLSSSSMNDSSNSEQLGGPSVSFAGFGDSAESGNLVPQTLESERERNRKKGIARLQRMERIKNVVKACLQPYYDHKEITRQDFKEIFIRAVPKVRDSNHEVDRHRIASLVKRYVKMFKGLKLIGSNQDSVL